MKKLFSLFLLAFCALDIMAAPIEPNLKWGKPTAEELNMTVYDADSSAAAVVLYRSVEVFYSYVNTGFRVFNNVKCRLKVLKPDGKDVGNGSIMYRALRSGSTMREYVSGLKAVAYNVENGETVKTKMEKSMVNEERVDKDWRIIKFSVPQVKVGTVIEFEYELESDYYFDLRDWEAQTDIPVLYTEYSVMIPEWLRFSIEESGMAKLEKNISSGGLNISGNTITTDEYHFVGRQLPALKDDDYVWCAIDYGSKVTHELRGIIIPGQVYKNFSSSWEEVDQQLLEDDEFGGLIKKSSPLKDEIAAAGIAAISDPTERATAVMQLLHQHVRWNGEYALWARSSSKVVKEGTGTNADINILYMNMLRDAGLTALPVVLRSRSRGHLPVSHPSLKYLSTFAVAVALTDSTFAVTDGSMIDDGCMNVLPANMLVERARLVSGDGMSGWVDLKAQAKSKEGTGIKAELHADGTVSGTCTTTFADEAAMYRRKAWRTAKDSTETVSKLQEKWGVGIEKYERDNGSYFSNTVKETFAFTKSFDAAGDMIYVNPLVLSPLSESPFTATERNLPVEFPYASAQSSSVALTLPEGYVVEDLPKPIVMTFDGITARVLMSQNGNMVVARYQLVIEKTFFETASYADLKGFFDKLVESCNHLITIKKQP